METQKQHSQQVEDIRMKIVDVRHDLQNLLATNPNKHLFEPYIGLMTAGLVGLHNSAKELVEYEIAQEDFLRGKHVRFSPRGVGLDACPCCFVCATTIRSPGANHYLNNISGFVQSKEDGEKVVDWFINGARLDFRPSEPNWIQVKVGACDRHLPNLVWLQNKTSAHRVIRLKDIQDARNFTETKVP